MKSLAKISPAKFEPLCIFIGFHSLEHEAIKKSLRVWDRKQVKFVQKNLTPDWSEIKQNNPSRSAKLFSWKIVHPKPESTSLEDGQNDKMNAVRFSL